MARHQAFWVILAGAVPTAFRSPRRDDLVPTLHQLQRTQENVTLRWFERGRVWDSPEAAHDALIEKRRQSRDRKDDWRPGGAHKDPRARYELTRDQKRARYKQRFGRPDQPPGDRKPGGHFEKPPSAGQPPGAPPNRPAQDRWRKPKPFGDRPREGGWPRENRPRGDRPPQGRWSRPPFGQNREHRGDDRPFKPRGPRPDGDNRDRFSNRPPNWRPKSGGKPPGAGHRSDEGFQPPKSSGFRPKPGGFGPKPGGFGRKPGGFGRKPGGFGPKPGGFGPKPGGFGRKPGGFKPKGSGFGPKPGGFRPKGGGFRPHGPRGPKKPR